MEGVVARKEPESTDCENSITFFNEYSIRIGYRYVYLMPVPPNLNFLIINFKSPVKESLRKFNRFCKEIKRLRQERLTGYSRV